MSIWVYGYMGSLLHSYTLTPLHPYTHTPLNERNKMQSPSAQGYNAAEKIVEIRNNEGLHMRPAMKFIECANSFDSKITVIKGSLVVDAKSIMQVATLAAGKGTQLKISAVGNDARKAVEKLAALIDGIPDSEE